MPENTAARPMPGLGDRAELGRSETKTPAPSPSIGDEVVQVHSDISMGFPMLVYEFMDSRSGSLVYQIQSTQMLNLVQDIRQRLLRMAANQFGEKK